MTDCADMDCEDCIWKWTGHSKRMCPRYTLTKTDQARRKLLKAATECRD